MQTGKVYLVGAGPGDPGLLTIKAQKCLEKADIVIYDYLANEQLLEYVNPEAECVYVGKKAGRHTMKQHEINKFLVESARKYTCVVRLKGGDPFLFGRGGEEALELLKNNICFEVVPGVSAGLAVPAYAGIPVTHRELASSVAFITGHEAQKARNSASVDWKRIADSCDTLVIYMGVKNLPNIAHDLISAGLSENTPVAMIREGTYNTQQTVTGTLHTIARHAQEHNMTPPAIIVVGNVVTLHEQLAWFENRPLFGKTVVITRNKTSEAKFSALLQHQGANIFHFPTIDIAEILPNKKLETALSNLNQYDWLLFTSGNAVRIFFERLFEQGNDMRSLHTIKIAVNGKPSAEKLREYYLKADFIPDLFTSEELVAGMLSKFSLAGTKILFPGSTLSNPSIAETLKNSGASVDVIPVYETKVATVDQNIVEDLKSRVRDRKIDWISFTSSSTVENFVEIVGSDFLAEQKQNIPVASIGPVTTQSLEKHEFQPLVTAGEHTFAGLVDSLIQGTKP